MPSLIRYVTLGMICKQAGKSRAAVSRALRMANVTTEKTSGVKGLRILEKDANRFLAKHWPDVRLFRLVD
jgi:hypothetical protein